MDKNKQALARVAVLAGGALILIVMLSSSIFLTIGSGEKGVLFKKFGGGMDKDKIYDQGFHVIAPWNTMYIYNVREQLKEEKLNVISSDGLNIEVDVSCRFHPRHDKIGYLHDEIGVNYGELIVKDLIRTTVRKVVGTYKPEELYSTKRDEIEKEIEESLENYLKEKNVVLQSVFVRSIKLPVEIETAIQDKLKQQQEAEKYVYKIDREKKEKERKMIEAEGIKEFQRIVSEGISDKLLRWKGIEATQDLAKSENAKVVIIGNSADGLPLILGGDK